jgi:hypothetical protein
MVRPPHWKSVADERRHFALGPPHTEPTMNSKTIAAILTALATTAGGTANARAQRGKPAVPQIELNEAGDTLERSYAAELQRLNRELTAALPNISAREKDGYLKARQDEKTAEAAIAVAEKRRGEIDTAKALVGHAKGKWIGGADKGIAEAKAKLAKATTDAERKAAREDLAKWEQNRKDGVEALNERQAALDKAERDRPKVERELSAAKDALAKAKAQTLASIKRLGLAAILASDKLDGKLAKHSVITEATPRGLAAFAQQGDAQRQLIERLLADEKLMIQMLVADGADGGRYGEAMQIYTAIQQARGKATEGPLQRLALAVALDHAVPNPQRNIVARTGTPADVDPVKRYLHFEKAFLDGELDPAFKNLTVWDYRMVVDGEEPDEILTWGREMLRNYRPDQITMPDYRWRYVTAVRTDIPYGSQDVKYDQDDLHFFQNILKNGGICGRRAFYGRFILRAFGIPTTARPQTGHAALAHWTPDGWVVCLGAGWGGGWTKTPYDRDLDFLATTQARATGETFLQVKRAQWIGDLAGEPRTYGLIGKNPAFWNGVSLDTQRALIAAANTKTLAAVGEALGEANESAKDREEIAAVTITDEDRNVLIDSRGVITVPAAAASNPTKSSGKILFLNSHLSGKQLHYSRTGRHQPFEYTIDAPAAGRYALTARVVTPSWNQSLALEVNGAKPVGIALPFTVGMWQDSPPVEIELAKGRNVLRFSRDGDVKGLSIREFTLTPQ